MNIVPLEGFLEAFRHPVALGALHRRGVHTGKPHARREVPRLMRRVGRTVVGEPFDPVREAIHQAEAVSIDSAIRSRTISPEILAVVAM